MNKQEIVVNRRTFYWSIRQDDKFLPGHTFLDIISPDRKFHIGYLLGSDLIIVKGSEFSDLPEAGLQWQWIETPIKGQQAAPRLIKNLVDWALSPKEKIKRLHYKYIDSH